MKKIIPQSLKNIYHLCRAITANVWYGFPSRKLKVIGVTGTNGKTTTVQMIVKILEEAEHKVAMASTINFKIAGREWVNNTKLTTLSIFGLQKHLRGAVQAGCDCAVIELTSHALDQNRAWGTDFSVAVLTNVTREHLDYHETMEAYAKAKEKLFVIVSRRTDGISVINLNSDFADGFLKYEVSRKYGYFLETQNPNCVQDKEIRLKIARNIQLSANGSKFMMDGEQYELNLPGEFNIENAVAAICVGLSQEISTKIISRALAKIKGIPGRMEKIENDLNLEIIVDYAVTPDSLEKLYNLLDGIKKEGSRVIAVFGSCGERDRGKRPIMGEIVAQHADYVFVTNEDPYGEDPQRIIDEVFGGVRKYKSEDINAWRILNRKEAIKKALQIAKPSDIIVISGKGAEEIMAVGSKRISWNDPRIIRELLQEIEPEKSQ